MYLREISKQLDLYNGYERVGKIFEDISVMNTNSALVNYLNPNSIETEEAFDSEIYPFGLNLNQREAVKKALNSKISIIMNENLFKIKADLVSIQNELIEKLENQAGIEILEK
ncbi:hypothetical protein GKZ28_17390 [Clostridium chromiireducens]|uniref:Uncharacterized protein n=1 Tax=Clostridium chromiireducens TaxID=225345 RepID=A0A964RP47_9CLOT|nr:hypothetical protein [Clostridium chromiireducens]MVX65459.1 hypothetical protein [Clostridium chromiireducens]